MTVTAYSQSCEISSQIYVEKEVGGTQMLKLAAVPLKSWVCRNYPSVPLHQLPKPCSTPCMAFDCTLGIPRRAGLSRQAQYEDEENEAGHDKSE